MLLAAGFGGRMVPITFFRAKPALPFLNRVLLLRQIDFLSAAGVEEVVVNLHHRPDSLIDLLAAASAGTPDPSAARRKAPAAGPFHIGSVTVHLSHEPDLLGTSGGLKRAESRFAGGGTFLCLNADFLCDVDLGAAVAAHRRSGCEATMVLKPAAEEDRFTPVRHDDRRVLGFGPTPGADTGVFTGIHVLEPGVLDRLPAGRSDFLGALYRPMIDAGEGPAAHVTETTWFEVGTPQRYLDGHMALLSAGGLGAHRPWSLPPPGASPAPTPAAPGSPRAANDVLVGRGCKLADGVRLGPGAILGRDVVLEEGVDLARCVIMDGAHIGARTVLRETIVGPGVTLPGNVELSRAVLDRGDLAAEVPTRQPTPRLWQGLWRADF